MHGHDGALVRVLATGPCAPHLTVVPANRARSVCAPRSGLVGVSTEMVPCWRGCKPVSLRSLQRWGDRVPPLRRPSEISAHARPGECRRRTRSRWHSRAAPPESPAVEASGDPSVSVPILGLYRGGDLLKTGRCAGRSGRHFDGNLTVVGIFCGILGGAAHFGDYVHRLRIAETGPRNSPPSEKESPGRMRDHHGLSGSRPTPVRGLVPATMSQQRVTMWCILGLRNCDVCCG